MHTNQNITQKIWNILSTKMFPSIDIDLKLYTKDKVTIKSILEKSIFINNLENFNKKIFEKHEYLNNLNTERIKILMQTKNKDSLMFQWIKNILDKGYIEIDSYLSDNKIISQNSFVINNVNFIRFYDNDEVFYILQHISFINGLYFPKRNLLICVSLEGGINLEPIGVFLQKIFSNIDTFIKYLNIKNKKFGGIISSYGRPYHFMYNHLAAAELLYQEGLLQKLEYCISIDKNWKYFDLVKIFPNTRLKHKYISDNYKNTIENLLKNKEFYLMCATNNISVLESGRLLKKRLLALAISNTDNELCNKIKKAERCSPLIWIGVTGQKRSWIEQTKGYTNIINKLSTIFPNLGIIFDGWTRSQFQVDNNIIPNSISQDNEIVHNILTKIDNKVNTFNLIGKTPFNKIAFANIIDTFIVNHGTGSMYVSCIAEKRGISHNSNSFRIAANRLHFHYEIYEIEQKYVKDLDKNNKKGIAEGDYSINWKHIFNATANILNSIKNTKIKYIEIEDVNESVK